MPSYKFEKIIAVAFQWHGHHPADHHPVLGALLCPQRHPGDARRVEAAHVSHGCGHGQGHDLPGNGPSSNSA